MRFPQTTLQLETLVDLLRYRKFDRPEQTAYIFLVDGETQAVSLTYSQLEQKARAIAAYLQTISLPGERALLIYPPGLEYIAAFFGCLYAGVVAVPAYPPRPNRSIDRIQAIVADAQAQVALTTKSVLSNLQRRFPLAPQLKTLNWLATDNIAESLSREWQEPKLNSTTLAFLQYTSGSTAVPKGVMITHRNLLYNSHLIYRCFELSAQSSVVSWLPMYHDMGLIGAILQPLYGGFPVILMSPLMFLQSPIRWLQAISRYRATISGGPNFAYDLCLHKIEPEQLRNLDLSSWKLAFNGAEPVNHHTLDRFASYFAACGFRREAFYPCYGMAEATLIVSGGSKKDPFVAKIVKAEELEQNRVVPARTDEDNIRILVGCGQELPGQKIIIVDPEKLTQCDRGEVGEIWVSGPSVAQGYWKQPQETQKTFSAYLADTGEGPFLRTGDLGFIDRGELFVTGRLKDVIIINGRNHYPQDIERTVEQNHPQIRPSCSAGFSIDVAGEEKLVVIAELERTYQQRYRQQQNGNKKAVRNSTLDTQELIQSIQTAVSKHHDLQVQNVLLLKAGSIPKTSSGKIQRHACRASFLAGTLDILDEN